MNALEELEKLMEENKDVLIRLKNGTPKPLKMEKKEYPECPLFDTDCPYCLASGECTIDNPFEECDDYHYFNERRKKETKVLLTKANDDYWYSFATFKTFDDLISYKEKAGCGLSILTNFWHNEDPDEIFKSWSQEDDKFTMKDAYSISECEYEVMIENSEY